MKIEKEFLIKNVEGDFYYSTVQLQGEINLTDSEKRKYFELGGCKNIKAKLIIELPKPILDDVERKYLSGVIRPFRSEVYTILKYRCKKTEWIILKTRTCNIPFPPFKKGTMYKGMELNKEYTLEDLNL